MMKKLFRYILLLIFSILIFAVAFMFFTTSEINIFLRDLAILSAFFALISLCSLIIFFKGQKKEPGSQILHSLVAVSVKLLLEMLLALGWFIIKKNTSLPSVLLFFVLYLTFTLFSVTVILKTLKNKPLENKS
jgi:hypothetical protein